MGQLNEIPGLTSRAEFAPRGLRGIFPHTVLHWVRMMQEQGPLACLQVVTVLDCLAWTGWCDYPGGGHRCPYVHTSCLVEGIPCLNWEMEHEVNLWWDDMEPWEWIKGRRGRMLWWVHVPTFMRPPSLSLSLLWARMLTGSTRVNGSATFECDAALISGYAPMG